MGRVLRSRNENAVSGSTTAKEIKGKPNKEPLGDNVKRAAKRVVFADQTNCAGNGQMETINKPATPHRRNSLRVLRNMDNISNKDSKQSKGNDTKQKCAPQKENKPSIVKGGKEVESVLNQSRDHKLSTSNLTSNNGNQFINEKVVVETKSVNGSSDILEDGFRGFDVLPMEEVIDLNISKIKSSRKSDTPEKKLKCALRTPAASNQNSIKKYLNVLTPNNAKNSTLNKSLSDKKNKSINKSGEVKKKVPVYKPENKRQSVSKKLLIGDKFHVYDFEVDENEPKRPMKKKRIKKIKLVRPKRQKKVIIAPPLTMTDNSINIISTRAAASGKNKFSPIEPDIICHENNSVKSIKEVELSSIANSGSNLKPPESTGFNEHATSMSGDIPVLFQNSFTTSFAQSPIKDSLPVKSIIRLLQFDTDSDKNIKANTSEREYEEIDTRNFLNDDLTPPVYKSVVSIL